MGTIVCCGYDQTQTLLAMVDWNKFDAHQYVSSCNFMWNNTAFILFAI